MEVDLTQKERFLNGEKWIVVNKTDSTEDMSDADSVEVIRDTEHQSEEEESEEEAVVVKKVETQPTQVEPGIYFK